MTRPMETEQGNPMTEFISYGAVMGGSAALLAILMRLF